MLSQPEHYRGQCHKCLVVNGSLVVTSGHPTPLFQTQNTAFDHVALGIVRLHKHDRSPATTAFFQTLRPLILAFGNDGAQFSTPKRLSTTRITIAFVQTSLARSLARTTSPDTRHPDRVQGRLQHFAVADLPLRQDQRQRPGTTVGTQMQLGCQTASAASQHFTEARLRRILGRGSGLSRCRWLCWLALRPPFSAFEAFSEAVETGLRAPAACGWALMVVLSTEQASHSTLD
jgi:hypothetical protein